MTKMEVKYGSWKSDFLAAVHISALKVQEEWGHHFGCTPVGSRAWGLHPLCPLLCLKAGQVLYSRCFTSHRIPDKGGLLKIWSVISGSNAYWTGKKIC